MAYLAYYRMFRPTTFDEVVRQEHIVRILKNQIAGDKIGHAYLFCGPRGTGSGQDACKSVQKNRILSDIEFTKFKTFDDVLNFRELRN